MSLYVSSWPQDAGKGVELNPGYALPHDENVGGKPKHAQPVESTLWEYTKPALLKVGLLRSGMRGEREIHTWRDKRHTYRESRE